MDEKQVEMEQEKFTKRDVNVLGKMLGLGAMILDLGNVDYTRGRVFSNGGRDATFWTNNGHKISISFGTDGGFVGSMSSEIDEDRPGVVCPEV